MNRIFIAKNEIENKALELKEILNMSEVEIYLALQGAFNNISTQLLTKTMYEERAHEIEIANLKEKVEKGDDTDGNESTSEH